ncbi:uncharacterized protein LOC134670879 [Cydia fagiglandana]|uniref:uncharacterized protein LOC134670879 n=1 Tax=Cydia fagiglandana TaxID=1458189 RepID=UPI002FEE414F
MANHSIGNQASPVVSQIKTPINASSSEEHPSTSAHITSHFVKGVAPRKVLATAVVSAESQNGGKYQLLRALVDQGSEESFIARSAVQLLGLKTTPTRVDTSGLGGEQGPSTRSIVEVSISSRLNPGCVFRVSAYVLDKVTRDLPSTAVSITSWPELELVTLADPEYHTSNKIDILLGAEVYARIIQDGIIKCPSGSLAAQNTTLGWILFGAVKSDQNTNIKVTTLHTHVEPVEELLKSFWEVEAEPSNKHKILSIEEQRCEDIFHSTTTRDEEGRYVVKLPFRDSEPACADGHSRDIALKRFHYLEKKMQKDERLKQEYKKVFDEYLELNHMKEIHDNKAKGCYIPYHAVIREDRQTTKFRAVFDASCKGTNGVSLNDDLMVGPRLQPELRHIIMRWRMYPICFIADIVKMYRQIKVSDEDSEFQRILWRETPEENIKEYKMLRVTFGTSSAPYLAVKSLIQVAKDEGKDFPLAAERVKHEFYMDDLMSGCESEEEAIEIYKQMNELLKRGGFELQKWASNSEAMLKQIQQDSLGKQDENKIEVKLEATNKILGLTWSRTSDEFVYAVQLPPMSAPVTKRKVISDISKLYDPQGWIAPSIIKAKIFIQKLWLAGIGWDEELPQPLLQEWTKYREDISDLTQFRLKRWVYYKADAKLVELHGFCDASNSAFAAVIYLRVIDARGGVHVSLITAKTRVSPIKQLSLPRLELSGAVLLAKLLIEVSGVLNIPKSNIHAWTDSEIVLAWLSSHPSRWKTFIGNRCSEILTVTDRNQWSHVKSEHNPADCASRGIRASELIGLELWLRGPSWLNEKGIQYTNPKGLETNLEERKIKTHLATSVEDHGEVDDILAKFSSLTKLLRVVAYCRRCLCKEKPKHQYLLKKEIDDALIIMIKKCQLQAFFEEWKDVKQGKPVSKKSVLTTLNPQLDDSELLRVGGRLHYAELDEDQKHPIILPKQSLLTTLVIRNAHKEMCLSPALDTQQQTNLN